MATPGVDPVSEGQPTSERDSTELRALDVYFPKTPKRKSFSDIEAICRILNLSGYAKWASQPRLYCIFRVTGLLHRLNGVLNDGITDLWLPTNSHSFKSMYGFSAEEVRSFSRAQDLVLANRLPSLESWPFRSHIPCHEDGESSITSLDTLENGGFWTVDAVQDHSTAKVAARKRLSIRHYSRGQHINGIISTELDVLKRLYHRHLLDLIGSYATRNCFAFLLSPMAEVDLSIYMERCRKITGYVAQLQGWIGCLASAVLYLHKNSIRHRHIKPSNILVNGGNVIIADFNTKTLLRATIGHVT